MFNDRQNCEAAESSEVLQVKRQARIIGKMAGDGDKCYASGSAVDVRAFHTLPTENKCW